MILSAVSVVLRVPLSSISAVAQCQRDQYGLHLLLSFCHKYCENLQVLENWDELHFLSNQYSILQEYCCLKQIFYFYPSRLSVPKDETSLTGLMKKVSLILFQSF